MLTVPMLTVLSNYSDLVLCHELWQSLVWSICRILSTVLTVFQILGACRDGSVSFTCHDDRMYHNGQGLLVPLAPKVRERINKVELPWSLDGSSFDPFPSVVAVARLTEVEWTFLGSFDTWLPYR